MLAYNGRISGMFRKVLYMRIIFVIFSTFCLLATSLSAHAASKKELEAKIIQLEQRLATMENRVLTGDPAAERLMQRMDALESSQRTQTGEVERLRYERDTLQEEVRALAAQIAEQQTIIDDMKRHLKAVDMVAARPTQASGPIIYGSGGADNGIYAGVGPPPTIMATPQSAIPSAVPSNDITQLASIGQDRLQSGDFIGAQTAFKQYLELNPDAPDRGDVYFWLGETYYAKSGFSDAADAYIASMRAAPNGAYAPEAMVKLAATARAMGQAEMACQTLASFPAQFPNADGAVREKVQTEKLRSGC